MPLFWTPRLRVAPPNPTLPTAAWSRGLDAKIAALQQLRDSYVAALSVGALGQSGLDVSALAPPVGTITAPVGQTASSGPVELPTGVFRTKGLADAIRLYLSIAKRKQTAKEIAAALLEGGLASTASNFEQTLSATLYRLKAAGELLLFKEGWDLAESYPESYRQRLAQNQDGAPKRKRKGKRKKADTAKKQDAKVKEVEKLVEKSEPVLRAS